MLTNGYRFWFKGGHVNMLTAPDASKDLQHAAGLLPEDGKVRLTKAQAITAARKVFSKLGYSDDMLGTEFEPNVELPETLDGHRIGPYKLTWPAANYTSDFDSVEIEIDAISGCPTHIFLLNRNLDRPEPPVNPRPACFESIENPRLPTTVTNDFEKRRIAQTLVPVLNDFLRRLIILG